MGAIPTVGAQCRPGWCRSRARMPRLAAIPKGCAFHPRCAHAFDRCRIERPEADAGRTVQGGLLARRRERRRGAGMTAAIAAPLVEAKGLTRVFDVSKPWLNRVIEGERKAYLKAVTGISFAIGRRETLALVGESGSGKSTVARMVVGLLRPDRRDASPSTASTCGRRRAPPSARSCAGACR